MEVYLDHMQKFHCAENQMSSHYQRLLILNKVQELELHSWQHTELFFISTHFLFSICQFLSNAQHQFLPILLQHAQQALHYFLRCNTQFMFYAFIRFLETSLDFNTRFIFFKYVISNMLPYVWYPSCYGIELFLYLWVIYPLSLTVPHPLLILSESFYRCHAKAGESVLIHGATGGVSED